MSAWNAENRESVVSVVRLRSLTVSATARYKRCGPAPGHGTNRIATEMAIERRRDAQLRTHLVDDAAQAPVGAALAPQRFPERSLGHGVEAGNRTALGPFSSRATV